MDNNYQLIKYYLKNDIDCILTVLIDINVQENHLKNRAFYEYINKKMILSRTGAEEYKSFRKDWDDCLIKLTEMNGVEEKHLKDIKYEAIDIDFSVKQITECLDSYKIYTVYDIIELLQSLLANNLNIDEVIVHNKSKNWNKEWYSNNFNKMLLRILKYTFLCYTSG